ncbi:MAG: accessory factor UbiK family protein [Alphaproteobacteria bacterium GM7ARS4]|nr:accessory factor UbiK family protein [Alphaproteobacteria bacterium GM7ARS4]
MDDQPRKKILDDLSMLAQGALHIADSVSDDLRILVHHTCQKILSDMALARREDLDALRAQLEETQKKVAQLENMQQTDKKSHRKA